MQNSKFKIPYSLYIVSAFLHVFLITPNFVSAATLSISGPKHDAILDEKFTVDVSLITLGERVNAVEGEVLYDRDLLYVEEIREDGSAISLWLTRPYKAEPGMVRFSGVIPGGSPSAETHIVSLVFKPLAAGNARIWFHNSRAFLNDGAGTAVPLSFEDYRVSVLEYTPNELRTVGRGEEVISPDDRMPPDLFRPEIGSDESVFGGQWFVAFSAVDRQSGVDHYEILEKYQVSSSKYQGEIAGEWIRAESPYLLKDQSLKSYIYVKAVDRAGNERVAMVEPQKKTNWLLWIVFGTLIALVVVRWKKGVLSFPRRRESRK